MLRFHLCTCLHLNAGKNRIPSWQKWDARVLKQTKQYRSRNKLVLRFRGVGESERKK